jgi:hypothetical protein
MWMRPGVGEKRNPSADVLQALRIDVGDALSAQFTSLKIAATLHIHVMRNASFGVIVTNLYAAIFRCDRLI